MKYEVTGIRCFIEIPLGIFKIISDLDEEAKRGCPYQQMMMWDLVEDIDYNGHFGNYIFFLADDHAAAKKFTSRLIDLVRKIT